MKRHILGCLLTLALAAAPLAMAQQKSDPAAKAKPSPLAKAREARQAIEKASSGGAAAKSAPVSAAAQTPAEAPAQLPEADEQPAARAPGKTIRASDRRDPFKTMIREAKSDGPQHVDCGPGVRGIRIGQAEVNGIVKAPAGYIAVVSVGGGLTYFLHEGNAVCNGVVQAITPESVVFVQSVLDPMGRIVKREVIKKIPAEAK